MSESKHTPEPWIFDEKNTWNGEAYYMVGIEGTKIAIAITGKLGAGDDVLSIANARRIVACVNAMAGMEDPERDMAALDKDMRDLTAENAALRAKLERVREAMYKNRVSVSGRFKTYICTTHEYGNERMLKHELFLMSEKVFHSAIIPKRTLTNPATGEIELVYKFSIVPIEIYDDIKEES